MPRFCANLTFLFSEKPLLERIPAARAAGFEAVEILFPYDEPAAAIAEEVRLNGLKMALINTPPPNWTGGERGFAAIPGGEARFEKDFDRALRFAKVLNAQHIHIMAGKASGSKARETFVRNLKWAAARAKAQSLTIEPINGNDMPGYFLNDFGLALEILKEVGAPNLKLQFDAYHAHILHGEDPDLWAKCAPHTVHVQVAGFPGRHEPVRGDIDYPAFFRMLDATGYKGWVSGEYQPEGKTEDGLGWMTAGS